MPLRIEIRGGRAAPIVFCDVCGNEITSAADGNYCWQIDKDGAPVGTQICFNHKRCWSRYEKTNGGWSAVTGENLDEMLVHLVRNLKVDPEMFGERLHRNAILEAAGD